MIRRPTNYLMTESLRDQLKKLESSLTQIINLFEKGDVEKLKNIDTDFERKILPTLKDLFTQYPSETDWVFRHGKDPAALSWLESCIRGEEKPYYRMGDKVVRIDPYLTLRMLYIQHLVRKLDEERAKVCEKIGKYEKFKETYQSLIDLAANLVEVYENIKSIAEIGYKFLKKIGILNYEEQKQKETKKQKEKEQVKIYLPILISLFLLSFLAFFHLVDFSTQGMFLAQPSVSASYLIIASMLLVVLFYFLFKKK